MLYRIIKRVPRLEPDNVDALNNLGHALLATNRPAEAVHQHEAALRLAPRSASLHNNLAAALQVLDRHDDAIAHYRQALSVRPDDASTWANLGMALREIGRIGEARDAFGRAAALAPNEARYLRYVADCTTLGTGDATIAIMEALAGRMAMLPEPEQRQLHSALAKAYSDTGQLALAFAHMAEGNRLQTIRLGYSEPAVLGQLQRIAATFTKPALAARQGLGHSSPVPIFIVGMPRSGTTLVEQVLASHPQVFGGGELQEFPRLMEETFGREQGLPPLADALTGQQVVSFGIALCGGDRKADGIHAHHR